MAHRARVLPLLALLAALACTAQAQNRNCGQAGQACCCKALDWQNPRCCSTGQQCTVFSGQGFGFPPVPESLCLPKSVQSCGGEGGACCLGQTVNGFLSAWCNSGLSCIPSSIPWASKGMYSKLQGDFWGSVKSASVVGTCKKTGGGDCGKAYMPCGKDAGCGSASCPSGFYCAAAYDAGVGDRCIPLPSNAGKAGSPCLPNNLPGAPVVKKADRSVAAPYCFDGSTCFTPTGGDTVGFTFDRPGEAKALATRVTGTLCVSVPSNCGKGAGKACCPTDGNALTDKALPTAAWGGAPCNPGAAKNGLYCSGNYAPLSGQPLGTCAENGPCGGDGQPCCKYSNADMAGLNCPGLGRPGAGYCNLQAKCRTCPKVLYIIEDLLRCY